MDLIITLGHNSSAIGVDSGGRIFAGYEEERFTRKKSESSFPTQSVLKILEVAKEQKIDQPGTIYISHWYDNYNFLDNHDNMNHNTYSRHVNWNLYFDLLKAGFVVKSLSEKLTHHDAHALSAVVFHRSQFESEGVLESLSSSFDSHVFVCDGFGNKQEVFSIYEYYKTAGTGGYRIEKVFSARGYHLSLGLMYQFATAFMGLKENQDEYKALGFEAHLMDRLTLTQRQIIEDYAVNYSRSIFNGMLGSYFQFTTKEQNEKYDSNFINLEDLVAVRKQWYDIFSDLLKDLEITPNDEDGFVMRVAISHFIQNVIELVHEDAIEYFKVKNIVLAGGVYFNVKLNNHILKNIDGTFCAMPLAGDQGAGIGVYEYYRPNEIALRDLNIGLRDLTPKKEQLERINSNEKLKQSVKIFELKKTYDAEENFVNFVMEKIKAGDIVNVVLGAMEFGPRALCNTSTLFQPTKENVEVNNIINDRNEVMPVCPVMSKHSARQIFRTKDIDRIIGSLKYMIIAIDYRRDITDKLLNEIPGVMHNYPYRNMGYTGRPQLSDGASRTMMQIIDNLSFRVLDDSKTYMSPYCTVNTSFNYHGVPIVYSLDHALDDFENNWKQKTEKNIDKNIWLVVGC